MDNLFYSILDMALAEQPLLTQLRREIHMRPGLGGDTFETAATVARRLDAFGVEYRHIENSSAIIATIHGAGPGGCLALRADMDGLPITEQNDVPYKSVYEGKMHACGHDAHTAILAVTAKLLKQMSHRFNGCVKLFFQPAEESGGGALPMIEAGALDDPAVDYAAALHVDHTFETGRLAVKHGPVHAASTEINIKITGKRTHGAHPESGVDSILAAAHVVTALQSVVSRSISAHDNAVFSIGTINGGEASNIIAPDVNMKCTLRSFDSKIKETCIGRIGQICRDIAAAFGAAGEIEVHESYPVCVNDRQMVDHFTAVVGSQNINVYDKPSMGSEDFAFFAGRVPSVYYGLGCRSEDMGMRHGHTPDFDIDEGCMPYGVAAHCALTLRMLGTE